MINKIHEKRIPVIYNNKKSTFQKCCKHKSVSIHNRNLKVLATKIYKSNKKVVPESFFKYFHVQKPA